MLQSFIDRMFRPWIVPIVGCLFTIPIAAQDGSTSREQIPTREAVEDGQLLWNNTSLVRSGQIEAHVPTVSKSLRELGEVDQATLDQLAKLQARLSRSGAHETWRTMKYDVRIDMTQVVPTSPASEIPASRAVGDFVIFKIRHPRPW